MNFIFILFKCINFTNCTWKTVY